MTVSKKVLMMQLMGHGDLGHHGQTALSSVAKEGHKDVFGFAEMKCMEGNRAPRNKRRRPESV